MPPMKKMMMGQGPVGGGPADVPFDRSGQMPTGVPDLSGGPAAGQSQQPVPDAPTGLLAAMGTIPTDQLSNQQLQGVVQSPPASPMGSQDQTFQELASALEDPNADPRLKALAEEQLALAARRSMLGGATR